MTSLTPGTGGGAVTSNLRIGLVGFGEVGQVLAADLAARGVRDVVAWDRLFRVAGSPPARAAGTAAGLRAGSGLGEALAGRTLVISAVTAAECLAVAREAAASIAPGTYYLDVNSVSPATKVAAAAAIDGAGGRFVEAAVMSPIGPKRSASPMLLGGPHAEAFGELAAALGLSGARHFAAVVGRASAAKMCRSVVVKGMEALLAESLLAARSYGVEASVLASLGDLLPAADWEQRAIYMMSRSVQHGLRRAEEMREVAKTVADAGIEPWMSSACAERQQWAAACAPLDAGLLLPDFLDAVLRRPTVAPEDPA